MAAHRAGEPGRRHGDEIGDGARERAEHRGMTLMIHSANIQTGLQQRWQTKVLVIAGQCRCWLRGSNRYAEAEPADPQKRGADHGHGQRGAISPCRSRRACADQQGADEAGDTGVDVHHRAACKVERVFLKMKPPSAITSSSFA